MVRETVGGRSVYLRRTKHGYVVKWGRTAISFHKNPLDAVREIMNLFGGII